MEEHPPDDPSSAAGCCTCHCSYCGGGGAKRRFSAMLVPARVALANEVSLLRSALGSQHSKARALQAELEAERSASASAASEALAMILRLQNERADALMELRQFRRVSDERSAHDQREIADLENQLYRRDRQIHVLNLSIHSLRHCLLSVHINNDDDDDVDVSMDSTRPAAIGVIRDCINELERLSDWLGSESVGPSQIRIGRPLPGSTESWWENTAVADAAMSCWPLSLTGSGGGLDSFASDAAVDCSKVIVGAVHAMANDYVSTPRERLTVSRKQKVLVGEEGRKLNKLYARLQALEGDRESMRQAILMNTEKAQVVLLREIAQPIYDREKKVVRRSLWSFFMRFSIVAAFKWVLSLVLKN